MANHTYTTVPGKIRALLDKIRDVGVPAKADLQWLKANGFTSSSDRSLLPVLKAIEFLNESNVPTERWRSYRGGSHAKQLADGIKVGYKQLFDHFSDASQRSDTDLENFFKASSDAGAQAISKTVSTFKALCQLADFTGDTGSTAEAEPDRAEIDPVATVVPLPVVPDPGDNTTININIQLSIPESANPDVYESLFAAMKKHLWTKRN